MVWASCLIWVPRRCSLNCLKMLVRGVVLVWAVGKLNKKQVPWGLSATKYSHDLPTLFIFSLWLKSMKFDASRIAVLVETAKKTHS